MMFRYVSVFSVNLPEEEMTGRCLPSPLTPLATKGSKRDVQSFDCFNNEYSISYLNN